MADPQTPYAGLTKPTVGADDNAWGGLLNTDLDLIDQFLRNIVPPGVSFDYRGPVSGGPPTGFLFEDGSAVSRSTYAALFGAIGTAYGAGDGAATFNLPDSRGRFTVGAGGLFALAQTGGALTYSGAADAHTLTAAEMPGHVHGVNDPGHNHVLHDPGHNHVLTDGGHNHAVNDPQHQHGLNSVVDNLGPFTPGHTYATPSGSLQISGGPTALASTGITLNPVLTGVGINPATTGVYHDAAVTGISTTSTGGGSPHTHTLTAIPTAPPYLAANKIIKT
jgi:microcystin-dependent protein